MKSSLSPALGIVLALLISFRATTWAQVESSSLTGTIMGQQ